MSIRKPLLFLAMMAMVLLISACGVTVSVPGTSNGTSSLTPLQVLQKSQDAMKNLKSAHVELRSTSTIQTSGSNAASAISTAGTPATTQNVTLNIKGNGDEALPQQMQLRIALTAMNGTTNLTEVLQGNQVYVQNAQGQWYVMDKDKLANVVDNPFAGLNIDQNTLLGLIQHATIVDHGTEALNGQNLRHISADMDKTALRELFNESPDLKGQLGRQNVDDLLNNTKSFTSSIDVWIDETQFYIHRSEFKLNLVADTSGLATAAPKNVAANLDTTLDLSKFNAPVSITVPTNATPTDNPGAIFGIGKP